MNENLPLYQSKATSEQRDENLKTYYNQYKLIKEQHEIEVPALFVSVRCVCLKKIRLASNAYRCLYCGIWFCKECAEQHFGYRTLQ